MNKLCDTNQMVIDMVLAGLEDCVDDYPERDEVNEVTDSLWALWSSPLTGGSKLTEPATDKFFGSSVVWPKITQLCFTAEGQVLYGNKNDFLWLISQVKKACQDYQIRSLNKDVQPGEFLPGLTREPAGVKILVSFLRWGAQKKGVQNGMVNYEWRLSSLGSINEMNLAEVLTATCMTKLLAKLLSFHPVANTVADFSDIFSDMEMRGFEAALITDEPDKAALWSQRAGLSPVEVLSRQDWSISDRKGLRGLLCGFDGEIHDVLLPILEQYSEDGDWRTPNRSMMAWPEVTPVDQPALRHIWGTLANAEPRRVHHPDFLVSLPWFQAAMQKSGNGFDTHDLFASLAGSFSDYWQTKTLSGQTVERFVDEYRAWSEKLDGSCPPWLSAGNMLRTLNNEDAIPGNVDNILKVVQECTKRAQTDKLLARCWSDKNLPFGVGRAVFNLYEDRVENLDSDQVWPDEALKIFKKQCPDTTSSGASDFLGALGVDSPWSWHPHSQAWQAFSVFLAGASLRINQKEKEGFVLVAELLSEIAVQAPQLLTTPVSDFKKTYQRPVLIDENSVSLLDFLSLNPAAANLAATIKKIVFKQDARQPSTFTVKRRRL